MGSLTNILKLALFVGIGRSNLRDLSLCLLCYGIISHVDLKAYREF